MTAPSPFSRGACTVKINGMQLRFSQPRRRHSALFCGGRQVVEFADRLLCTVYTLLGTWQTHTDKSFALFVDTPGKATLGQLGMMPLSQLEGQEFREKGQVLPRRRNFFKGFCSLLVKHFPPVGVKLNKEFYATMPSNDGNKLLISCRLYQTISDPRRKQTVEQK